MDDDSDVEYADIDEKVDEMEIDGQREIVEKDEQTLTINERIWKSMYDHVIDQIISHKIDWWKRRNRFQGFMFSGLSCSPYL